MDTTRADHLACYGNPDIRTPNIDRLASEGTLFERCITTAPITLVAHSSMLTGSQPFVHGARDNGTYVLHGDNVTLAEVLHDAGYATHAEVAAFVLNREFGLDQGFDQYVDIRAAENPIDAPERRTFTERTAEEVTSHALAWLDQRDASRPFFLFVHYFDPHRPWAPPKRFAAQYKDPYLAEIAYTDEQIGRLLAWLDQRKLADDTIVVLTADHGEGLGQHHEMTHGCFLYDTTLHVPLIVRHPPQVPTGRRVMQQVRIIDIAPTILDLAGVPVQRLSRAQGRSLRELFVASDDPPPARIAYSESFYGRNNFGYAIIRALRVGGWKLIWAPRPELYHVEVDPLELNDLADVEPERVRRMSEQLRGLIAQTLERVRAVSARREASAEDVQKLAALGYVSQTSTDTQPADADELALFEPVGPNPMDHAEEIFQTAAAMPLIRYGRFEQAAAALQKIIDAAPQDSPGFAWAHANLGAVLAFQKKFRQAIEHYDLALRANPHDSRTMVNKAICLLMLGRVDEAVELCRQALKIPPVFATTHQYLAVGLALQGRIDEALEHYRKAVELDPSLGTAYSNMARVLLASNRLDEALAAIEKAVRLEPDRYQLRYLAGLLCLDLQRPAAARDHLLEYLRHQPEDWRAQTALGEAYNALHDVPHAVAALSRSVSLNERQPRAWELLGFLLMQSGRQREAVEAFRKGLAIAPGNLTMINNLAWILATSPDPHLRNGPEAVELVERVLAGGERKDPALLDTYAAALAQAGRFDDAVAAIDQAIATARAQNNTALVQRLTARRALYASGRPYRTGP